MKIPSAGTVIISLVCFGMFCSWLHHLATNPPGLLKIGVSIVIAVFILGALWKKGHEKWRR